MRLVVFVLVAATAVPALVLADPPYVVRPEPGLVCMNVSVPALSQRGIKGVQAWDGLPHIKTAPTRDAEPIAMASAVIFAVSPLHVENGYVEVRTYRNTEGWLPKALLTPYHSQLDPNAKCIPSLRSDGSLGIASR